MPRTPIIMISIWGNIWRLPAGKKSTSPFTFSLSYSFIAKILWTCSGYFGHVWLCTPKVILSIYRKLLCLSADKKSTSSPCFSEEWLVSTLVDNSRTRIFPIIGLVLKYQQEMARFLKKIQKKYLGANLGPFCSNLVKNAFSCKGGLW